MKRINKLKNKMSINKNRNIMPTNKIHITI